MDLPRGTGDRDDIAMELLQFHKLRTAVQVNASPGTGDAVASMAKSLRTMLLESQVFEEVEVEHTDDLDRLVVALCTFRPYFNEADVARYLERMWNDRLRYPFWEAHATFTDRGHVEFEAATRAGSGGHYVTIHLIAQRVRVPVQRRPSD